MQQVSDGSQNIDHATVASFGEEWARFDQERLSSAEVAQMFAAYFKVFPWTALPSNAEGFDMGCGTGRWAKLAATRVGSIHCIEPSMEALDIARRKLAGATNIKFHNRDAATVDLPENSQDFGYSLGVLHHIPDTEQAMRHCVRLLKPGAPFLVYLYYRFDNRPWWYVLIWKLSDMCRRGISALPNKLKWVLTDSLAALFYWPLAKLSKYGERLGLKMQLMPLYSYRDASFYTMRTDSRDRFGTPLELRFTRCEIRGMMERAGLTLIEFSNAPPYWCAVGRKSG